MEVWKKFETVEVSNMGNLKTPRHKDGTWSGGIGGVGYKQVGIGNKKVANVHRLVAHLFLDMPLDDTRQVDHINGDRHDNRVENLRMVTQRENSHNKITHRNGSLVGSSYCKQNKKWMSQIKIKGKSVYLGYYDTELEAHERYKEELKTLK